MKRSEINQILKNSVAFLERMHFALPPYAFWTPEEWNDKGPECREIVESRLGWDITDFGSNAFDHVGLLLFTIRNGTVADLQNSTGKTYAEKVMIVQERQVTPTHFHQQKMEDVINRGGGNLVVQVWNADFEGHLDEHDVTIRVDCVKKTVRAGTMLVLHPGESVCLTQRLFHSFWGQEGSGPVLVGEVSSVNVDSGDNVFLKKAGRFPVIEEDVVPFHLLCFDYPKYYRFC